ncbi:hypothetical protein [Pacificibacter marinus]|uniref:hypothetical protein n=1 Tax=Pacificibacter marinus TaxID=658057 RepID=UPI001C064D00|nr:hypothetical protein [Pacificibacter marinus]MBU2867021.1 hypothetical protein [Pacificibacter marinus]
MCLMKQPNISAASQVFASSNNSESVRQADIEARLRRRRGGAAANVLTSANGIPATPKLGSAV